MAKADDIQIGGTHYKDLDIEPWAAMYDWLTQEEFIGFLKGCAIKRLARCGLKGSEIEDIKKAHHELGKCIEIMEEGLNYSVKELDLDLDMIDDLAQNIQSASRFADAIINNTK